MSAVPGDVLVVGIGRLDRRDDGVGLVVAAALQEKRLHGVDVVTLAAPVSLLEAWVGYRRVVVVDAVLSGQPGGSVRVEQVGADRLPARGRSGGTHALGIPEVVELGRALGSLPEELTIVGVEAVDVGFGNGLSPSVAAAVGDATRVVVDATRASARA
ncbi:MAG TPA: hydrogenase maturation protease [Acidothermaceae bacterium]|nr:hydrogenase maturation protease [Acidothermaceae bacterium]